MSAFMRKTTTLCLSILLGLVAVSLQAQTAQFLWEDSNTQGAWQSVYGNDGYNIISSSTQYQNYPSYATVTPIGQTEYTWGTNLSVPNGLQEPGVQPPNNRIAAQWYSNTIFTLDINLTDGQTHQVALYCLDYGDTNGRSQTVAVTNPQTGAVLDSRTENTFTSGQYLVWNVSGHVQIQLLRLAAYNATVSGIFFDPVSRPTVVGLSQQSGATHTSVTVFGYNFGTSGTLAFNGTNATTTQWSNNSITATVPTGATTGPVTVTAGGKQSNNTATFTVLSGQTLQFLGENGFTEFEHAVSKLPSLCYGHAHWANGVHLGHEPFRPPRAAGTWCTTAKQPHCCYMGFEYKLHHRCKSHGRPYSRSRRVLPRLGQSRARRDSQHPERAKPKRTGQPYCLVFQQWRLSCLEFERTHPDPIHKPSWSECGA
jgi:hypothetical protein